MKTRVSSVRFLALAALAASSLAAGCSSDKGDNAGGTNDMGAGGSGGAGGQGATGPAPTLPAAPAACPEFHSGMATINSSGVDRQFQIWVDDAAALAKDGPIVVFWYGTLGSPMDATKALTDAGIKTITDAGGVVAAPVHDNMGTFPWIQDADRNTDYHLMDDIVACAKEKVGIDARRVHTVGFSAGALFAADLSYQRSNYLASVATFSGGGMGTPVDPSNLFPAMILFGGDNDMFVLNFKDSSKQYYDTLTGLGHFAFECNHGLGHALPPDAGPSVVQFFMDHPFGTNPSPYKSGLPASFPKYCSLTPPS